MPLTMYSSYMASNWSAETTL